MRILQICSARSVGGGERHLADLTNALTERGHEIFVALAPDSPLKNELNLPPERILFARMRNALDISSAFKLAKFLRQNQVGIVHAHLARDYTLAAVASQLTKTPFVLTRHVLFPLKSFHKYFLRRVSGVIAVSEGVADTLQKQNIFAPEKITVVRNGIDTARFSPENRKPNSILRIGTVGEFSAIKGQADFVRAAAIVLQKRADVEFEIAGDDKSKTGENRAEIEKLISDLGLQNKIRLLGWLTDVRPFLRSLDLLVSPSRLDSFGLAIAEAMSCGVPVVAAKTAGAMEIIETETNGALISLENPTEMAGAILDLLENEEKRIQLAADGRRRIITEFSLEKMVTQTEEFYRRVLEKSA